MRERSKHRSAVAVLVYLHTDAMTYNPKTWTCFMLSVLYSNILFGTIYKNCEEI